MKVAAITFHHAHNFGSALQTYALQTFIISLGYANNKPIEYQVIDFYTPFQENFYSIYRKGWSLKVLTKNLIAFLHREALKTKYHKFEAFLHEQIHLTERFPDLKALQCHPIDADCYVSGSDQIWNVRAQDFSDAYYLAFVTMGRKVAYAASFGPQAINWTHYDTAKYTAYLNQYNSLSVRELGSRENVHTLTGKECEIHVDPTLLLSVDEWRKIQAPPPTCERTYILLYCLEPTMEQMNMAQSISRTLQIPIIVLCYNNKHDIINPFIKCYDAGPLDFLSYIDHAALVLTSSFHGTAFSLIYHKPFYVFGGMTDKRISHILKATGMEHRAINHTTDLANINFTQPDGTAIDVFLQQERTRSSEYLKKAIGF